MTKLLLGIDVGSTVVKAVVFDLRGRSVAHAAHRAPVNLPQPGWVERDAEKTWRVLAGVIRRAVGTHAAAIQAVGITGCGNGAIFLDADRKPLRPGILSSDTRASRLLGARKPDALNRAYPGQTRALLRWLRADEPGQAARLQCVLFWKDYMRFRLTGELATDFTDAGASGLLDARKKRWCADDPVQPVLVEALNLAGKINSAAAHATGLRVGTPVAMGCIDCEAAALGSGLSKPGELSIVAGTWSVNQTFATKIPTAAKRLFLCNPSVQTGRWLVIEGSPTSASQFDWWVHLQRKRADFFQIAAEAEKASRSALLFLPHLFSQQAAFIGLGISHDRAALARAVMEGIVFSHRGHMETLQAAGLRLRKIRLAGGATRSPFWCQLFADILNLPISVASVAEPGALGAALCAGVGVGLWRNLSSAQDATFTGAQHYQPRANYEAAYARFQQAFRALKKFSPSLS